MQSSAMLNRNVFRITGSSFKNTSCENVFQEKARVRCYNDKTANVMIQGIPH